MILLRTFYILIVGFIALNVATGYSFTRLYCYRCVSTHPGCGNFNWLYYWSQQCPEDNDKCVKIVERKGGEEIITRDCLSSVRAFRTDVPADHYEGCRSASKDVRLAQYVNNSISELDVRRDHYDSVEWCFCYFDNRCNHSSISFVSESLLLISLFTTILNFIRT